MSADPAKALASVIKKLSDRFGDEPTPDFAAGPDPAERLVEETVRSFILWESTRSKAAPALRRLMAAMVDYNELRVCMPEEVAGILGERYPRVVERCQRMRSVLNAIYTREHAVTLEHLTQENKRQAREYLQGLEGMPPFVSARVSLVALGGHAMPIDGRIMRCLVRSGIVESGMSEEDAAGSVERKVRAGELASVYRLVQAWADEDADSEPASTGKGKATTPSNGVAPKKDASKVDEAKTKSRNGTKSIAQTRSSKNATGRDHREAGRS